MTPRPEPAPMLPYAPAAEPGELLIQPHEGGLTVVVPPVGWTSRLSASLIAAGTQLFLAAVNAVAVAGWVRGPLAYALGAGVLLFGASGFYTLAFAYHLSARRVRIDVDETHLRRTMQGPFLRTRKAWDRRMIKKLFDVKKETTPAADPAFFLLYLRTRDGKKHLLCDSADAGELKRVSAALTAALQN